jgi:mercuric ion transport protein
MPDHDLSGTAPTARTSRRAALAGVVGSGLALLCCAGVAPVLGLLAAIGLGFLIHDAVLIPLLLVALGVTGWGLRQGRRCHGQDAPGRLGLAGAVVAVGGLFLWVPLAFAGFGAVILASIWNGRLLAACTRPTSPSA